MKNLQRLAAALLAAAMLAGCTGDPKDKTTSGGDSPEGVAMGRYVEETWTPPFEAVNIAGMHIRPDGRIAMLLNDAAGEQKYYSTTDGDDWREDPPAWLAELMETAAFVDRIHYNGKGEAAAAYFATDSGAGGSKIALASADGVLTYSPIGEEGSPWWDSDSMFYAMQEAAEEADEESDDDIAAASPGGVVAADPGEDDSDEAEDGEEASVEDPFAGGMPLYIRDLYLRDDGLIYIVGYQNAGCFDPVTGEKKTDYLEEGQSFTVAGDQAVQLLYKNDAEYAGIQIDETTVFFLDPDTGEEVRKQPAGVVKEGRRGGGLLQGQPDGALYLVDAGGIFRMAAGGEIWEKFVDGGLSSLSMPSVYPTAFFPHGEDQFLLLTGGQSPSLINFVYSADTPTLPDMELDIYMLQKNQTVPQAVGVFRKTHPNVLVNIHSASEGDDAVSGDDAIRALNTELLAGKGPDLILLDYMPMDSYIEKGVLADLAPFVKPLMESGEVLPNIVGAFEEDGKIFAAPTRFTMPTLWGEAEAIEAASSLESLADYFARNPDLRMFVDLSPELMLFEFGRAQMDILVGEDGQVDVDLLENLYTNVQHICDTAGDAYNLDGEPSVFSEWVWQNADEADSAGAFALAADQARLMFGNLNGFYSLMMPNMGAYRQNGGGSAPVPMTEYMSTTVPDGMVNKVFRPLPAARGRSIPGPGEGNRFYPTSIIGINAASERQELAGEFVRAMLSELTQGSDLYNGLPVNQAVIDKTVAAQNDAVVSHSYMAEDGSGVEAMVEATWPTEAMLRAVCDAFDRLDAPVLDNYNLMELIIGESQPLFEGSEPPRQTAERVAQKARLQLAE